jgi:hypothetical protein
MKHPRLLHLLLPAIVAIIAMSGMAFAAPPAAPVNVVARAMGSGGFVPVYVGWSGGDAGATRYDLYMRAVSQPGTTFSVIREVADTTSGGSFFAVTGELANGTYDFYVKAVNGDGASPASSTVRVVISGTSIRFAQNTYYFDSTFVGTRVVRDFDAVSSDGGAIVYSMSNIPSGATFDTQNGIFDWTPSEPGVHSLLVTASLASDPSVSVSITYTVIVNYSQSDLCATITGTVRDENGANVDGIAQVSVLLSGGGSTLLESAIRNGAFSLSVPQGTMIVQVLGDLFRAEYYNDASSSNTAERLTLACSQTRALTISVTRIDFGPDDSITGRVVDASTGRGVAGAHVQFFISPGNRLINEFEANSNGVYLAIVPRDTMYKARAYDPANQYEAEYFGGTASPNGATVIDPRAISSGVDFFLTPTPSHRSTLQGRLIDTAGNRLDGTIVASRIDSSGALAETFEPWGRSGEYFIFDLDPGEYVVWGESSDSTHAPGYYRAGATAALSWTDATRITVANGDSISGISIVLVNKDGFGGKARITGDIVAGKGAIRKSDDPALFGLEPVEGATVYALDAANHVAAYAMSNQRGHFEITGLADGAYTILVDKIGLEPLRQPAIASQSGGSTLELQMESRSSHVPVAISEANDLEIIPNPIGTAAAIRFDATPGTTTLTLSDLTGTALISRTIATSGGRNSVALEPAGLPSGTYLLRIGTGATALTRLVIISH